MGANTAARALRSREVVAAESRAAAVSGVNGIASSAAAGRPQPAAAPANTPLAAQISLSQAWLQNYIDEMHTYTESLGAEEKELMRKLSPLSAVKSESRDSPYLESSATESPELTAMESVALSARARRQHFGDATRLGVMTAAGPQVLPHTSNLLTSELGLHRSQTGAQVETPESDRVAREGRPGALATHLLSGMRLAMDTTVNTSALDALVGGAVAGGAPPATARRDVLHSIERAHGRLSIVLREAGVDPTNPKEGDAERVTTIMRRVGERLLDEEDGTARKTGGAMGTILELATAAVNTAGGGNIDDPAAVMGRQVARRLTMGGTPVAPSKSDVAAESAFMARNLMQDKRTRGVVLRYSPGEEEKRHRQLVAQQREASRAAAAAGDAVLQDLFEAGAKPLAMGLKTAKKAHKNRKGFSVVGARLSK